MGVNRYGEDFAFQIGFDFALELGARLAMNPMGTGRWRMNCAPAFASSRELHAGDRRTAAQ